MRTPAGIGAGFFNHVPDPRHQMTDPGAVASPLKRRPPGTVPGQVTVDLSNQPWAATWHPLPLKFCIRSFACCYRCLTITHFCRRNGKTHRFNIKYFCSKLKMKDTCGKGHDNWSTWTSTKGKKSRYCKTCRQMRAQAYLDRKKKIGSHTKKEWEDKLIQYDKCPSCKRSWSEIKPSKGQAKYHITKDHITPLSKDGTDSIDNIQPLCYQCNFKKGSKHD